MLAKADEFECFYFRLIVSLILYQLEQSKHEEKKNQVLHPRKKLFLVFQCD